jgi:hypothetical protein
VFRRLAVLFASGTLLASQDSSPSSRQQPMRTSMSLREFKQLREHARTAEEFRKLAEWCQLKAGLYRKSEANCAAELQNYYTQSSPQSSPKHPTRGHDLHTLVLHYRELSRHWTELSGLFSDKAVELESRTSK